MSQYIDKNMPPKLNPTQAAAYIAAVQEEARVRAENARIAAEISAAMAEQKKIDDAKKAADALAAAQTASSNTASIMSEDDKRNKKCFEAGVAKKNYIQYVNNKLAFNSQITSSGNGCVSDRPNGFMVEQGKTASGLHIDGDCYDESGINIANEPTHVLYNSTSRNRLMNGNVCLSYNSDGSFNKVSQTPTFDFASGWSFDNNMLIPNRDRNKAIRVNGDRLELAEKQPGNLEFLWEREGGEFRNLKTNKCMNIVEMKVTDCAGPVRHTRWDYIDNKLLKNRRTGRCLDSNGNNVYMSGCDINNPFQHWSIENNGSIIRHAASGKCLAQKENNSKTEFELVDCKCEGITPGELSEKSYLDYIKGFSSSCMVDEWGYHKTGDACLYIATQNYQILDKLLSWCDKNQKNESVNKYCFEFMKYNDLLQYYSRMCSEDNGVGEKPFCIKVAIDSDTLILDEKAREFIKIKWDEAMYKSCEKGMMFTKADKDANKFKWKYTVNDIDEECLDNWTFRDTSVNPAVDTIVKKTTALGDNGYWCPTISGSNDPRLNCSNHNKILNFLKTESKYTSYNNVWKEEGANTELPLRIYKKFVFRIDANLDTWRTYIKNEFKLSSVNKDKIHFAYFALFYGGFPIKVNTATPFGIRYYSLNGKNYIYKESNYDGVKVARVTMTAKGPTGATPGFDVIVPPYREYFVNIAGDKRKITNTSNYYYLLVTDSGTVYGVKSDGSKENIAPVSPFDNKDIYNSNSTAFIIFLLILVIAVIVTFASCKNRLLAYFNLRKHSKIE